MTLIQVVAMVEPRGIEPLTSTMPLKRIRPKTAETRALCYTQTRNDGRTKHRFAAYLPHFYRNPKTARCEADTSAPGLATTR